MAAGREFGSARVRLPLGGDLPVNAPHKRTSRPNRREEPVTPPQRRIPDPIPQPVPEPEQEPVRTAPPTPVPAPARREPVPA